MRHLWRAGRTLFVILVGAVLALAVVSPAGALAASTPAIAVQQVATSAYDTPAYAYDAPARLASPDTATTGARGSPAGPGAVSWGSAVFVRGDVVAAETGAGYVASDVDNVAAHLSTLDHFEANDVMIARIRSALAEGRPLSEGQQNFMLHETREAELMRGGMGYEAAHDEALTVHPPGRNYDPDVIDQFEEFGPWWREMNGLDPR